MSKAVTLLSPRVLERKVGLKIVLGYMLAGCVWIT